MQQRIISATGPFQNGSTVAIDENFLADHIEKYLLADDNRAACNVFSSVCGGVHVYCFPPSDLLGREYWTIVTMGISGTKMNVPDDVQNPDEWSRCELICYLPANWDFPASLHGQSDAKSWPLDMIRAVGTYVSSTGAWLADSHGLPNLLTNPPGQPFCAITKLSHMILLWPVLEKDGFDTCLLPTGEVVKFYVVIPLTPAEAQWKREVGAAESIFRIVGSKEVGGDNVAVDYIIDPERLCAVEDLKCR